MFGPRRWLTLEDVEGDPEWIVDKNLMMARHKHARPNDFFFLCTDEGSVGQAHSKKQKELMSKERLVEVNQNGAVRRMTVAQFRKEFADWEYAPGAEAKEEKTDENEVTVQ